MQWPEHCKERRMMSQKNSFQNVVLLCKWGCRPIWNILRFWYQAKAAISVWHSKALFHVLKRNVTMRIRKNKYYANSGALALVSIIQLFQLCQSLERVSVPTTRPNAILGHVGRKQENQFNLQKRVLHCSLISGMGKKVTFRSKINFRRISGKRKMKIIRSEYHHHFRAIEDLAICKRILFFCTASQRCWCSPWNRKEPPTRFFSHFLIHPSRDVTNLGKTWRIHQREEFTVK